MTKNPTTQIQVPPKLHPVFTPQRGEVRYRAAYGGRGSGKSYTFALMAALYGYAEPLRILCTREFQTSIKESFHAELRAAIQSIPWLEAAYDIGIDYLRGHNGTEFIFRGLRRNMQSIRSMASVDLCIIEEGEDVPEQAWRDLLPTIRAPGSEVWAIWNPRDEGSPVDQRFVQNPPDNAVIAEVNYCDNPWFPQVLEDERRKDRERMDPSDYAHVWEGKYLENSEAQILANKWRVAEFIPGEDWGGPYHGLDFGYAQDPTAANRMWIADDCLYIEMEAHKVGLDLDKTPKFLESCIPGIGSYTIRADSSRPESISYLQRHGLPRIIGASKWSGSVLDGINHLRSYKEIVIHPRCKETIKEARLYSWKVDKHTGDILPTPVDANNHHIDDLRYGLDPLIRQKQAPKVRRLG